MKKCLCLILALLLLLSAVPAAGAYEIGEPYRKDLSQWITNREYREYVQMMLDYHLRSNKMVQDALKGGFSAVFLFDGCSDNLDDPELADLTYYRVSGVCIVLKHSQNGELRMLYFNDNCSTIPDRPLEYGAWNLPEVGAVGPATICDGTYQLYSVRHKGKYEALHVRTEYYDDRVDAVYMTPDGYVNARANEINVHTRTSNHISSRGMWSAGCPLVGGGRTTEFWRLMNAAYYNIYDTFALNNFVGVLTVDRMPLRRELYTLYENPDAVDRFLTNSRIIQPETYLRTCSQQEIYPKTQRMKVAMDTAVMSLPCSNDTDARSLQRMPLMEGMKLNVLGSVCNAQGNFWYQVELDGQNGYVYERHLMKLGLFDQFWDAILN